MIPITDAHARISPLEFRLICGRFATGVCVLTACNRDGVPHGLTINSFTSVSLDPPLVMVAIAHSSTQLAGFDDAHFFAVNILAETQQSLSVYFATREPGRFDGIRWTPGKTGAPLLEETLGVIECRTVQRFDAGDHRILVGEAVAAETHEGRPLLYYRSGYGGFQ
jgi:flavin reductase (DIM6/NTAB) family NADH-FMN oxidoreductase RutF